MKPISLLAGIFFSLNLSLHAAGQHRGESDKIQAQVSFLNPSGQTTTDATGITYVAGSWQSYEPKIYPPNYWGTYPLYFAGSIMNFSVTLTNTADQGNKNLKIRVQALNHVLNTDGTQGSPISSPQEWVVDSLRPGETRTLYNSIYVGSDPNLPSGLDTTKIRILHLNEGNNAEAGLIKEEVAIWCPPPRN
ncbi:MAG: hypothetical protein HY399_07220 [Elusimicrobia bacterium]|nr:hypothetical protein [Elusimicrobiota bacterium]